MMAPLTAPQENSPVQSHKTSPASSPNSSLYGGTPSQPASELAEGPSLKKRSKPAVILSKVKKSLTSTITENVAGRDAAGRPVAMVKGLISSLTGSVSQSNVTMATADAASIATTIESNTSDVFPVFDDVPVVVTGNNNIIMPLIIPYDALQRSRTYYHL